MRSCVLPIEASAAAASAPAGAEQPPDALTKRLVAYRRPSFISAIARTNEYSSTRTRVSTSARPLSGVNWKIAEIGEGFASMIRYSFATYRLGVCGKRVRIAIGTTAASTARAGASRISAPSGAASIVRPSNRLARTLSQIGLAAGSSPGCSVAAWASATAAMPSSAAIRMHHLTTTKVTSVQ